MTYFYSHMSTVWDVFETHMRCWGGIIWDFSGSYETFGCSYGGYLGLIWRNPGVHMRLLGAHMSLWGVIWQVFRFIWHISGAHIVLLGGHLGGF